MGGIVFKDLDNRRSWGKAKLPTPKPSSSNSVLSTPHTAIQITKNLAPIKPRLFSGASIARFFGGGNSDKK